MRIINDKRIVLSHHGILGQRWGIRRTARERKAANVLMRNAGDGTKETRLTNKSDLKDAEWLTKPISEKLGRTIAIAATSAIVSDIVSGKAASIIRSPKELSKRFAGIAKQTIINAGIKELKARSSMNRYKDSGIPDPTKKQYKGITPEQILAGVTKTAIVLAPIIHTLSKMNYSDVAGNPDYKPSSKTSTLAGSSTTVNSILDKVND